MGQNHELDQETTPPLESGLGAAGGPVWSRDRMSPWEEDEVRSDVPGEEGEELHHPGGARRRSEELHLIRIPPFGGFHGVPEPSGGIMDPLWSENTLVRCSPGPVGSTTRPRSEEE